MAIYKVIQDVEAEDKLVGPLTFRQFVYAGVAGMLGFLSFFLITHKAGFLSIPFIPIAMISAFFAWPWSRDQPTEIWALAKIRFLFKSRKRIWDQTGARELVTVTAPRRVTINYTNGLNQVEVRSRLKTLATTLDTRGWAIRNANINAPIASDRLNASSDRLVTSTGIPAQVPDIEVRASDDIMDPQNNPIAQQFDTMINASAQAHRQQIISNLQPGAAAPTPESSRWFLGKPSHSSVSTPQNAVTFNSQVLTPGAAVTGLPASTPATPTADEEQLIEKIKTDDKETSSNSYRHLHTIQPLSVQRQQAVSKKRQPARVAAATKPQAVTQPNGTAILDLASNNDLSVATIQREAQKRRPPDQEEVVIPLH